MKTSHFKLTTLIFSCILTACGGGGGGSTTDPVVTGGADTTTTATTTVPVVTGGNLAITVPPTTYALASAEKLMFDQLNQVRKDGGFGMFTQKTSLDQSALSQAKYFQQNYVDQTTGVVLTGTFDTVNGVERAHTQSPTGLGYIGYLPVDRAKVFGYSGEVGEVLVSTNDTTNQAIATRCIEGWLVSPAHRVAILNPTTTEIGFGVFAGTFQDMFGYIGKTCAATPSFNATSVGVTPANWMAVIPLRGETNVQTNGAVGQSGYASSIHFPEGSTVAVTTFEITKTSTAAKLDAAIDTTFSSHVVFLKPTFPLENITEYEVHFVGTETSTVGATPKNVDEKWRFTTR